MFAKLSLCVLALAIFAPLGTTALGQGRPDRVPGEFLIKVTEEVDLDQIQERVAESAPVEIKKVYPRHRTLLVKATEDSVQDAAAFTAAMRPLVASGAVTTIEPNFLYYPSVLPDDERIDELWFLSTISAPAAWDIQNESPEIIVAVIDTGVFYGHEDLAGRIWTNTGEIPGNGADDDENGYVDDVRGWDFYNGDADPAADKVAVDQFPPLCIAHPTKKRYEAHGTHVAGTIGAHGNNGKGISGISWNVKIMPLKFLGGMCGAGSTDDAIDAVDYAVANGASIINNSWGGGGESTILRDAIQAASDANVLVVCAAGNTADNDNDINPHYPSSYDVDSIVAVAATDQDDALASFSCFGAISVDLAAPGTAILSSIPAGDENSAMPTSGYAAFRGTSMATPIVSGSSALLRARFPDATASQIKSLLLSTVDGVEELDDKCVTGGRLNVRKALDPPLTPAIAAQIEQLPDGQKAFFQDPEQRLNLFLQKPFNYEAPSEEEVAVNASSSTYEILIQWKPGSDVPDALEGFTKSLRSQLEGGVQITPVKTSPKRPLTVIEVQTVLSEAELLNAIRQHAYVDKAELQKTWRKD